MAQTALHYRQRQKMGYHQTSTTYNMFMAPLFNVTTGLSLNLIIPTSTCEVPWNAHTCLFYCFQFTILAASQRVYLHSFKLHRIATAGNVTHDRDLDSQRVGRYNSNRGPSVRIAQHGRRRYASSGECVFYADKPVVGSTGMGTGDIRASLVTSLLFLSQCACLSFYSQVPNNGIADQYSFTVDLSLPPPSGNMFLDGLATYLPSFNQSFSSLEAYTGMPYFTAQGSGASISVEVSTAFDCVFGSML